MPTVLHNISSSDSRLFAGDWKHKSLTFWKSVSFKEQKKNISQLITAVLSLEIVWGLWIFANWSSNNLKDSYFGNTIKNLRCGRLSGEENFTSWSIQRN